MVYLKLQRARLCVRSVLNNTTVTVTAFYFLKAERNSMGTHFVYVVTFF